MAMPPETPRSMRAKAAESLLWIVEQLSQLLDPLLLDLLDIGTVDLGFLARRGRDSALDPGLLLLDREADFFPGGKLDLVLEDFLADQPAQTQPIRLHHGTRAAVQLHHALLDERGEFELATDLLDQGLLNVDVEHRMLALRYSLILSARNSSRPSISTELACVVLEC